jgi:hypothetical protein
MPFRAWVARGLPQCGAPGMVALRVERDEWRPLATAVGAEGGFLAALWAGADMPGRVRVHAAYYADNRGLIATLESVDNLPCPGIEDVFPAAARMQRAMTDLSGVQTTAPDTRPWLRHGAWRPEEYPLAGGCCVPPAEGPVDQYGFVRVQGDGVHEIGVGPVHASSQATSASRSLAKRSCGSRSGSATRTRASSCASLRCRPPKVTVWQRAYPAIPRSRSPGPIARQSRRLPAASSRSAPHHFAPSTSR